VFDELSIISGSKIMAKMLQIREIPANPLWQGFSNCGSRPHLGSQKNWLKKSDIHVFVNFTKKLNSKLGVNLFLLHFSGNTVFHAVSCFY